MAIDVIIAIGSASSPWLVREPYKHMYFVSPSSVGWLIIPVSYTHLDVYKRQIQDAARLGELGGDLHMAKR